MDKFTITVETTYEPMAGETEAPDAFFDRVMDELSGLDGIIDSSLLLNTGTREADFVIHGQGVDIETGLAKVFAAVRCAVHAAGGGTPHWLVEVDGVNADSKAYADA